MNNEGVNMPTFEGSQGHHGNIYKTFGSACLDLMTLESMHVFLPIPYKTAEYKPERCVMRKEISTK